MMGTETVKEGILSVINEAGKPLQFKQILQGIRSRNASVNDSTVRTILSGLVADSIVKHIKFSKLHGYYCKPNWVDDTGQLAIEFDPYFGEK